MLGLASTVIGEVINRSDKIMADLRKEANMTSSLILINGGFSAT